MALTSKHEGGVSEHGARRQQLEVVRVAWRVDAAPADVVLECDVSGYQPHAQDGRGDLRVEGVGLLWVSMDEVRLDY